jgi:hypothetical protein
MANGHLMVCKKMMVPGFWWPFEPLNHKRCLTMIARAAGQAQYGLWACAFLGPRGAPNTREPFFFCPETQNLASRKLLKALIAKETRKQEGASCRHARCFRLSNRPPFLDHVYWAQSCKGARLHECTRALCKRRFSTLWRCLTWLNAGVCPPLSLPYEPT